MPAIIASRSRSTRGPSHWALGVGRVCHGGLSGLLGHLGLPVDLAFAGAGRSAPLRSRPGPRLKAPPAT